MVFTNDELRNPVTFDPSDPMTWTVSDWETCWASREAIPGDYSVAGSNEVRKVF
jgi:hypothetical protein